MSLNSFGHLFRVTTWGESHGSAIGCVIDGCPPNIPIDKFRIQAALDQRKPGTSQYVTQRREPDQVDIMSGIFEDDRTKGLVSTGTPISMIIHNQDQRSKDYNDIRDVYRPGHADFTYDAKYGARDYRGGGRSSARETAMRVAAGAVAQMVLDTLFKTSITISAYLVELGGHAIDRTRFDFNQINQNPFWCPDHEMVTPWENAVDSARKNGSSLGAIIAAGLGAPVYAKLDADIAANMMSINAVKSVEIGAGLEAARLTGAENADQIRIKNNIPHFLSNQAGGILGGISTGQDIVARMAIKPTSSILTPQKTITRDHLETEVQTKGRHDPCVGIRGVPVAIAMLACTLCDHALLHRGQCGVS